MKKLLLLLSTTFCVNAFALPSNIECFNLDEDSEFTSIVIQRDSDDLSQTIDAYIYNSKNELIKKYETEIIKIITQKFPNVTSVSVGETVKKVKEIILKSSLIIKWCAALIIFLGFFVIIGALSTSEQNRIFESSILKTLGASKKIILLPILLRSVIIGSFAGLVAIILGAIMSWVVISYFLNSEFSFFVSSAIWITLTGIFISLITSTFFAIKPINSKPAKILKTID